MRGVQITLQIANVHARLGSRVADIVTACKEGKYSPSRCSSSHPVAPRKTRSWAAVEAVNISRKIIDGRAQSGRVVDLAVDKQVPSTNRRFLTRHQTDLYSKEKGGTRN